MEFLGGHAIRTGEADVDQTDRLALGCTARPGDAGGSDREIRTERAARPFGHLSGALGADCPPRGERLLRDAQERCLRRVGIGDDAAQEVTG